VISRVLKLLKWPLIAIALVVGTAIGLRTYDMQRGPPLELWHTEVPHELSQGELRKADWATWLAAEKAVFEEVRAKVTAKLPPEAQVPANRYFEGSAVYPGRFAQDWNRSFVLEPSGPVRGAVVLLHGLTDSPYSQRHIAALSRPRLSGRRRRLQKCNVGERAIALPGS